jgi:hypothetical protein
MIPQLTGLAVLRSCTGQAIRDEFTAFELKAYRDQVVGAAADPVEKMMVEQLLWAHHRLGHLHGAAIRATTIETAEAYNAAAVRLMAECRKMSLALREYRTPLIPRNVTVVKQQNLTAGDQQIAYIDGQTVPRAPAKNSRNGELVTKQQEAMSYEPVREDFAQSKALRGRETEPVQARPVDAAGQ